MLLLFIPSVIHDIGYLADYDFRIPHFAVFWPDLGLFFLGAFLWEHRVKAEKFSRYLPVCFLLGLLLTAGGTLAVSMRGHLPDKTLISCIGSIGVVSMAASFFCLCMAFREKLQRMPEYAKKLVHAAGTASMGVYLIHPLVMQMMGGAYNNTGSLAHMFADAGGYFLASVFVCWCGRRIPYIGRLF